MLTALAQDPGPGGRAPQACRTQDGPQEAHGRAGCSRRVPAGTSASALGPGAPGKACLAVFTAPPQTQRLQSTLTHRAIRASGAHAGSPLEELWRRRAASGKQRSLGLLY